ncbi:MULTISPECIES: spondin domain-containing protein [unclassified Moorena]|uniref:spondin domain-containing protein n=1 Tax=unclassified Moorena TaxID=2683338 RepID=UPI0013BB4150|nr:MULTISPECIES: spondin domain-containing protein [unclassified Moorena]NEP30711.1 PEP-CTERM sorting domain-containing protein [Moorena sp. SIO3B2]NEQ05851.1 PEP-CTERM sorting domain-containing protein [Moorena sp. SIO4E2]
MNGIKGLKNQAIFLASLLTVGSTVSIASTANAVTLKVTVENLTPENGGVVTPVWFGFHDGSFDSFNIGESASSGIEALAEDAITGLEATVPGLVESFIELGLDPNDVPPQSSLIAGLFADSAAAQNGGVQGIVVDLDSPLGLFSGDVVSTKIKLDEDLASNSFFSYGAMYFPSNDAFIANDNPIAIFDGDGKFIGADFIVLGDQVWDAGTEVNDENPLNVPFDLAVVGDGIDENGLVLPHPGFLPAGSGGVLDFGDGLFANADFTTPGFQVARITIEKVPEPATITGLLLLGGLSILRRRVGRSR